MQAITEAVAAIGDAIRKRETYEAEQAELTRLRQEEAERKQREHEERLKAEAAAKAKAEAEEKARAAAAKAEQERLAIQHAKFAMLTAQPGQGYLLTTGILTSSLLSSTLRAQRQTAWRHCCIMSLNLNVSCLRFSAQLSSKKRKNMDIPCNLHHQRHYESISCWRY